MRRLKLHWQILIALLVAVLAGGLSGTEGGVFGVSFYSIYDFLGRLFISALTMIIVPLIASSIVTGVAGIGRTGGLGRLGGRTLFFYVLTSGLAIFVGLVLVNAIQPGISDGHPVRNELALAASRSEVRAQVVHGGGAAELVQIFVRMIPSNIVEAAANADMLGIIFFSLLFGYFLTRIDEKRAETVLSFWQGVFQVMMRMTEWVMLFAPIGVFGLVAKVVAKTGLEAAEPLLVFSGTVLLALAIHALVTMPLLLRFVARVSPWRMYQRMAPALLTAFSTASSSATLPVTMDCVERGGGVSNRVSSFVLPLGATMNMNGTALYECIAAIFLAQAYGLNLSFGLQFIVIVTALVTSIGAAGVPSASLVAIAIILKAVGLPLEAIGVLFVFDRILDMARTSMNVFGDTVCAVIVARLEGETNLLPDVVQAE